MIPNEKITYGDQIKGLVVASGNEEWLCTGDLFLPMTVKNKKVIIPDREFVRAGDRVCNMESPKAYWKKNMPPTPQNLPGTFLVTHPCLLEGFWGERGGGHKK